VKKESRVVGSQCVAGSFCMFRLGTRDYNRAIPIGGGVSDPATRRVQPRTGSLLLSVFASLLERSTEYKFTSNKILISKNQERTVGGEWIEKRLQC
jgi:hypothetical protein